MFRMWGTVISVGNAISGLVSYQLSPFSWKIWGGASDGNSAEICDASRLCSFDAKPTNQFRRNVTTALGGNAAAPIVERRRRGAPAGPVSTFHLRIGSRLKRFFLENGDD